MKTRLIAISLLATSSAAILSAGPGLDYWNKNAAPKPANTAPVAPSCGSCACCPMGK